MSSHLREGRLRVSMIPDRRGPAGGIRHRFAPNALRRFRRRRARVVPFYGACGDPCVQIASNRAKNER